MKNRIAPTSAFGSAYVNQFAPAPKHRIAEEARKEALKPLKAAGGQLTTIKHGRGTLPGITRDASEVGEVSRRRAESFMREGW